MDLPLDLMMLMAVKADLLVKASCLLSDQRHVCSAFCALDSPGVCKSFQTELSPRRNRRPEPFQFGPELSNLEHFHNSWNRPLAHFSPLGSLVHKGFIYY